MDGDQDTRWAVKPLDSLIEVDLGAVYTINAAEVLSYAGRGYQFTISVSTDGSTFTQVVDESDTTEPDITRSEFSAIEARYVRLNLTGAYNYTNNFPGITEFRIFGYTVPVSTV